MTKKSRIYNGEKTVSSTRVFESWAAPCKSMKLEHSLMPFIKINPK